MQSLSKRANAMSHLSAVRVYDYSTREEDKRVDAGFLMCRTTDCLHVLRSLIVKHALTLEEEEEEEEEEEKAAAAVAEEEEKAAAAVAEEEEEVTGHTTG